MPLTCSFFVVILNYILVVIYNCSLVASISAPIFKVNLDGLTNFSLFFSATYSVKGQWLDVLPVACPTSVKPLTGTCSTDPALWP